MSFSTTSKTGERLRDNLDQLVTAGGPGSGIHSEGGKTEWEHNGVKRTDTKPYSVGQKVKTDSGETGEVSHVQVNEPGYSHGYRVSDDKNEGKRLENGNYISHKRLTPI